MRQRLFSLIFFILLLQNSFSQSPLKGKVILDALNLQNINITNLTSKTKTITSNEGYFSIMAKVNDTLFFSGLQTIGIQVVVRQTDFNENLFLVKLKQQARQLDEIFIKKYDEYDAVKLGILLKPAKEFTPAESRINEATGGGILALNPILNAISGRTKLLKKELAIEKKEILLDKLKSLYNNTFYTETLKIPSDYVNGFQYYVIDDPELIVSINSKNKYMTTFLLGGLAEKYKLILSSEKK